MKKTLLEKVFMLTSLSFLILSCKKTDTEILNKTITKINSLETIEYQWTRKMVSTKLPSNNRVDSANAYFDFSSRDTLIGTKYHFNGVYGERVFDGVTEFKTDPERKTVIYNGQPKKYDVTNSYSMSHSIFEIKKLLPKLLVDTTIISEHKPDTLINNIECYKFKFSIPNRYIGMEAILVNTDIENYVLEYTIAISKNEYLPIQIKTTYPQKAGYTATTLKNIKIPSKRNDSIWNYKIFSKGYLTLSQSDYNKRRRNKNSTKIGQLAKNWTLPNIKGDSISFSKLDKNLILLEFWYPGCLPCVKAIPIINEIQHKYGEKGFAAYGIEFTLSSDEGLGKYIKEQNIRYQTLYMGSETAKDYGVYAAPTFFLIKKSGEIIYTNVGLNKEELIKKIEENI
ncbi:TlpA family protein disulfide reductase [Aquimarina macrocephali]|uniref:TlpA family protein disulfide reductase n=1 Tax=Aquimarina macrocephali TaxID=666563 RepID=UPI001377B08B|nr:TlpA disulfide reductase family protein [Aquimarina macrocephali]